MRIYIDKELNELLGDFRLGFLKAEVQITETVTELEKIKNEHIDKMALQYKLAEINKIPAVDSNRKAYRAVGNDPNRYRPAADSLLRRIVKGNGLYTINTVVDVLNIISIKSGFSISGFDAADIQGEINMGIGQLEEPYEGVGRGVVNINKLPVLRDAISAFGCPTSDSVRTSIKSSTHKILFVFYDFGVHEHLRTSMEKCVELLNLYSHARNTSIEIQSYS